MSRRRPARSVSPPMPFVFGATDIMLRKDLRVTTRTRDGDAFPGRRPMKSLKFLYAATIFLSAFLLFQIQPIIAKMILPWFGGSSSVWSACMLFFQAMLLIGYLYAHWLQGRPAARQGFIHIGVLAVSLIALPIAADPSWKPSPADNPSLRILGLLAVTVGLPYFLVSTTS